MTELTDEALVAAWVEGDRDAFDELVRRYSRRVYGICFRYFGDATDAEDAAQDAFVALLRRAHTFAGTASFSTWMYRVAVNACNDLARKRSRRPQAARDSAELADEQSPAAEDLLGRREDAMVLRDALAQLDTETRQAIVLHDVQGLPYQDIADQLGMAVGTVKSRIHRGHHKLADLLTATGTLPPPTTSNSSP